jgi:glucose/arabinose dehydrogenase
VGRAGIWRFSATQAGQTFPSGGEQVATGVRDMTALAWSPADASLYGIMHGRDNMDRTFPGVISAQAQAEVADEMDRVTPGTNFGWPYTYYNGVKNVRLLAPGYGGNGTTLAPAGNYATPVVAFTPRSAPVALVFYSGHAFPAAYRGGAVIALHGTRGENGYDIVFVPWNGQGKAGAPTIFASGFAQLRPAGQRSGPPAAGGRLQPEYRPVGLAVGPDGALYIADSQQGRIWRVSYAGH